MSNSTGPSGSAVTPQQTSTKVQPKVTRRDIHSGSEIDVDTYWKYRRVIEEKFNRDQKVELAKAIAGSIGAVITFPNAREGVLRKENQELAKTLGKNSTKSRPSAKPENAKMKGAPEEKSLHEAQSNLRAKRLELGLAKSDTTNIALKTQIEALNKAKAAFEAKKKSFAA